MRVASYTLFAATRPDTVTAFGVLADVDTGYPLLLTEMTLLTALRTAATSAVAAKYLAPANSRVMAVIGNGAQWCEARQSEVPTIRYARRRPLLGGWRRSAR